MRFKTNIWKIAGVIILLILAIVFFKIVIYLAISSILFLIGSPITNRIEKIKIGSKKIPDSISALLTLGIIATVIFSLFRLIFPPLINQIDLLSGLNFYDVLHNFLIQFPALNDLIKNIGGEHDLKIALSNQMNNIINLDNMSLVINNTFSYAGTILGGIFCVSFITFFFLKDERLLKEGILSVTPSNMEEEIGDILNKSKKMLSKYFAGLFIDMLIVGICAGSILYFLGIKNALIIGFTAGLLNMVPYIGAILTMLIAVFLGISSCIAQNEYELIQSVITKIFFTLISINLLDGFLLQPLIFSNSVKAHPLEIFIATLMGAIIGGIPGMIVALPCYTILRIVAKEFLSHFKFFRKITEKIDD